MSSTWPWPLTGAAVWFAAFLLQTLLVRGTVAASKMRRGQPLWPVRIAAIVVAGIALWLAARTVSPGAAALAVLPAAAHALALAIRPVSARHLKRVGWSLVLADLAVLAVLLATIR